jgi:hypothetical protein
MKNDDKEYSLEQIRSAQAEIALEMEKEELTKNEMLSLEKATLHLRNLERLLVATLEKTMIAALKEESKALKTLSEEMEETSKRLFKLTNFLREIVKITGRVIDILALVK